MNQGFVSVALSPQQSPQMISGRPDIPASILLTWSMPDVTDAEAPLTGYQIIFEDSRFLSLARAIEDMDVIFVVVGLQTSHLQTGLSPNTEYFVQISAINLIGTGQPSVNFQVTSGEGST